MALFIFDMDGTLYQSEDYYPVSHKAIIAHLAKKKQMGEEEAESLFTQTQKDLKKQDKKHTPSDCYEALGLSREDFFAALNSRDVKLFVNFSERTKEALEILAKKHDLVVYTNSPEKTTKNILQELQILSCFSSLYTANRFPQYKPYGPALKFIKATHPSHPIIYVGDSAERDLGPARKMGAKTVLVSITDMSHPLADAVVRDVGDLPSVPFIAALL